MRALLAQLCPRPGEVDVNVARAADVVSTHPDVAIAAFPELFASGYRTEGLEPVALAPPFDALAPVAEAAAGAETAVVIGFVEGAEDGFFNSLACFDHGGGLAAVCRKTHLFGAENEGFRPGDALAIVELAGRRVAPMICFEIEFPEPARATAEAGADLFLTAAANMESGQDEQAIACRARALENRIPHLYVNRVGEESGHVFCGGTRAIDANGAVTAMVPGRGEELLFADVGPAGVDDDRLDYLALRREGLRVHASAIVGGSE